MRILIVEDNATLAEGLTSVLRSSGYVVDAVGDGESAMAALAAHSFDLVLLDLSLPDMDGLDILSDIRARGADCAVLVLTARGALDERIRGLDKGADDYMTKPFEVGEVEARIRALLRRLAGARDARLECGPLTFDLNARQAALNGTPLDLPARELNVLQILISRAEKVVSKTRIAERLSEFDEDISDNAVEQYVSRLRKRLEPHGVRIRTARGLGYCLEAG
ncbi:response regulator transcription factor [Rhizobiales bacterium]|uniref:response regulator transcription factor n=1 Tax=Hongsoonwoonella zoysiae TaxID=2821844 RepID=UPI00155FC145|nr:response regulator transcription factor [Hongsoonwoonella zoysiae]NRG16705.1 response regulator transcription factor [Hongsoonwoonella zoysiae]